MNTPTNLPPPSLDIAGTRVVSRLGRRGRQRRLRRSTVMAMATASALFAPATAANAQQRDHASPPADGSVVIEWNATAMDVLTPSGRPLITQPFVVATMHVAIYDAVVAIEGQFEPFVAEIPASADASPAAAAAQAAHDVLVAYLPASTPTFDAVLARTLDQVPDGAPEAGGIEVGRVAAQQALALRFDDGSQSGASPSSPPPGPGQWQPTPPNTSGLTPWIATARPFVMDRPDQFRPPAPPALTSPQYERALDEVRRLGSATSAERTDEQTAVARFWADQPIAQNQRALRGQASRLGWDLARTARLFAVALTTQADSLIACWDAKYHYQFWRPWQSVPQVEAGWAPLLGTPNHPEFPSAHGCVTGSLGYALSRLMHTEHIELEMDALGTGTIRRFSTRRELLTEVGDARIHGGLHYRFSVDAGLDLARQVVQLTLRTRFRPVP